MTAQIAEKLRYQGEDLSICTTPLCDYFAMGGSHPPFEYRYTALRRGYVGSWDIVNDRLYLIGLSGRLRDGAMLTLATIFPDYPDRVFAHWYSGTMRIPKGKLIEYVHMGFSSTYERDLLIEVEQGLVLGTRVRDNGTAGPDHAAEGYKIGAVTVFHGTRSPGERSA